MSDYFVVHLKNVSHAAEEWLSESAFEFGASGLSEPLAFDQPEGEEDVHTRHLDVHAVDVYFANPPPPEFIERLKHLFPAIQCEIRTEPNRDWLAEWKKSFQPFALVGSHWVVPSWCAPPAEAKHKIWIDPGMAFGTGTHETTQLVAEALVQIWPSAQPKRVLDVGTGTGILAILARQLGATHLVATEIEPEARRVAFENFARNRCADVQMDERQVQDLTETFDMVVANIIDGVLVRLQSELKARVRPGGWLVLSGIITEREPDFLAGFTMPHWDLRLQRGDWLLYAVRL